MKANHGDLVIHIPTGYKCMVADKSATRFMPLSSMWDIGAGLGETLIFRGDFDSLFQIYKANKDAYIEYPSRKRQFLDQLQALQSDKDHERAGSIAQDLLLAYIGDKDITEAYNKINQY